MYKLKQIIELAQECDIEVAQLLLESIRLKQELITLRMMSNQAALPNNQGRYSADDVVKKCLRINL